MPVQVRTNLALFEIAQEDAVNPPREEPGEVRLSHGERQFADVLAVGAKIGAGRQNASRNGPSEESRAEAVRRGQMPGGDPACRANSRLSPF